MGAAIAVRVGWRAIAIQWGVADPTADDRLRLALSIQGRPPVIALSLWGR